MCSNLIFFVIIRNICGFFPVLPKFMSHFSINGQISQVFIPRSAMDVRKMIDIFSIHPTGFYYGFPIFKNTGAKFLMQCSTICLGICINNNPDYWFCAGCTDESP